MSNVKKAFRFGFLSLALGLSGCGGGDGDSADASSNTNNTTETTLEKSFTVSLDHVDVARIADGMPVTLETSAVSSSGTVTIRQ